MAPATPPSSSPRKRRVASPASGVKTPPLSREAAIPETTSEDPKDGDHDETAALLDEVDIHIVQEDGMLRLPSELLEMVASNLLGTKHILNLGLANKRLSRIVQETIVRNLIVSGRNINGFLAMLSHHPELLSKVSSVYLGEFGCSHGFGCPCASSDSLNRHVLRALGAAISETTGHTADWSQIRDSNASGSVVWRRETAFSLDVLATSCPSIKSVTVQLPEARSFSSGQPPRPRQRAPLAFPALNPELLPTAPFQGPALHLFQAKLEALTIAVDIRWKGPPTLEVLESHDLKWRNMGSHIITLANFSRLKRLDIPMDILGRPNDIIFSPTGSLVAATQHVDASPDGALPVGKTLAELRSKVIPLSIQNLRLRSCNKWTFALLQRINEIPLGELRLKHIGLSFDTPSKHLIIQCNAVEQGPLDYLRLLADLDRKRIEVTFYHESQDAPVDMRKELKAFSLLQPFEVWRCSGSSIPFSKWNPEVSEQRRLLTAGSRLFLRHADHHPQLLNSPTFDLRLWAQGAFFHGIENSKWDPQLQDPNKKVQAIDPSDWNQRTLGKCAFRRRLSPLLNLDTFQFGFYIEQKLTLPPKETLFLGASFTIVENTCAQPPDHHRDTGKKPAAKEEQTKRSKQVERTEPAAYTTNESQGLEVDIERLQLESAHAIPMTSKFSGAQWSSVMWKLILQPKKMACVMGCPKQLGGV